MAGSQKRKALGKGLGALLPTGDTGRPQPAGKSYFLCPIEWIQPNRYQPRKVFDEVKLGELINSVKEKGILQPLIVRSDGENRYELIAGERRWRAAQKVGLKEVPVLVKDVSDKESLELAIIENIQRADLNPVEEAEGYKRLIDEFSYTQEELASRVGKERATVANHLRILKLPGEILKEIAAGLISLGHAKAILSLDKREDMFEVRKGILKKGLSVREVEALTKKLKKGPPAQKKAALRDVDMIKIEDRLTSRLGTKVRIVHLGEKGKIEIDYYSTDELDRLIEILVT